MKRLLSQKAAWALIAAAYQLKVDDAQTATSVGIAQYGLCNAVDFVSDQISYNTLVAMNRGLSAHLHDNDPDDIHSYIAGSDIDTVEGQQDRATFSLLLSEAAR